MDQSDCWEANGFSATQETPCILYNEKITVLTGGVWRSLSWARLILPNSPIIFSTTFLILSPLNRSGLKCFFCSRFPNRNILCFFVPFSILSFILILPSGAGYNFRSKFNDSSWGKSLSCADFVRETRRIEEGQFKDLDAERKIILK